MFKRETRSNQILKTPEINLFLEHDLPVMNTVKKLFEQRELNQELQQELKSNELNKNIKNKI